MTRITYLPAPVVTPVTKKTIPPEGKMKSMMSPKKPTHPLEESQYSMESLIENNEVAIQNLT
jgi:hypothetical protein